MSIIFVSIPLSLILMALAVWFFFWAVNSGQYDDLDSPAYSVLLEDEETERPAAKDEQDTDK